MKKILVTLLILFSSSVFAGGITIENNSKYPMYLPLELASGRPIPAGQLAYLMSGKLLVYCISQHQTNRCSVHITIPNEGERIEGRFTVSMPELKLISADVTKGKFEIMAQDKVRFTYPIS